MKAMAAMTKGTTQCHLRSLKCLELHPAPSMATAVGAYSVTVIRAILALCQACTSKTLSFPKRPSNPSEFHQVHSMAFAARNIRWT